MRNGFIFDHDLCVGCKACSAACMIENEWSFNARNIYIREASSHPAGRKINLSMACNHCSEPVCLNGCPSKAYHRDPQTSAVISDSHKCIGCRYCLWNCPYDAPKFNSYARVIEKCHFCNHRLIKGTEPACSASCPTGALRFGEIQAGTNAGSYRWMPEKGLDPSLTLQGKPQAKALKLIPPAKEQESMNSGMQPDNLRDHWSLVLFSFIITCAVSVNIAVSAGNQIIRRYLPVVLLLIAGVFSLLHLNSPLKAWKSLINPFKSPLSREIALYIIYTVSVTAEIIIPGTVVQTAVLATGFLLLLSIDHVYNYADRSPFMMLHSGQVFLTSLLISSYLLNSIIPFLFIALLKFIYNIFVTVKHKQLQFILSLRFLRIALLLITSMILITNTEINRFTGLLVLFSGEFTDRILYYLDFDPVNIRNTINEPILKN
jgi:Fe-S-cluster-containing dehydrogenase component